jgi:hypothetical protein
MECLNNTGLSKSWKLLLVSKSKLLYDWQSVSHYVLVSSTLGGLATRYYFLSECCCLNFAVLFLWSTLSDERTGRGGGGGYFTTDSQSVSQSLCLGIEHPCETCDQILLPVGMLLSEICCLVSLGHPLWREDEKRRRRRRLLYDWQSVSQSVSHYVLASSTLVGLATRYYFLSECCCLNFAVLFLWGTLSDERTGRGGGGGGYFTTDSQSLCLGIEHPCGTWTRYYFLLECCFLKFNVLFLWGTISDERTGRGGGGGGGYFTTDSQSVSQSVSQYVLVSSTLVRLATRYYFLLECCFLKFAVLFLWGILSDERTERGGGGGGYFTTDSQSVCLCIEHPCGTCDQILQYFLSEYVSINILDIIHFSTEIKCESHSL